MSIQNGKPNQQQNLSLADLGTISCCHCKKKLISAGLVLEAVPLKPGQQLSVMQLIAIVIGVHVGTHHAEKAMASNAAVPMVVDRMAIAIAASHVMVTGAKSAEDDLLNIGDECLAKIEEELERRSDAITANRIESPEVETALGDPPVPASLPKLPRT